MKPCDDEQSVCAWGVRRAPHPGFNDQIHQYAYFSPNAVAQNVRGVRFLVVSWRTLGAVYVDRAGFCTVLWVRRVHPTDALLHEIVSEVTDFSSPPPRGKRTSPCSRWTTFVFDVPHLTTLLVLPTPIDRPDCQVSSSPTTRSLGVVSIVVPYHCCSHYWTKLRRRGSINCPCLRDHQ